MFDAEKFIHIIETKECIWKVSHKNYLNRKVKRKAWYEVAQEMYLEWNTMPLSKKTQICK